MTEVYLPGTRYRQRLHLSFLPVSRSSRCRHCHLAEGTAARVSTTCQVICHSYLESLLPVSLILASTCQPKKNSIEIIRLPSCTICTHIGTCKRLRKCKHLSNFYNGYKAQKIAHNALPPSISRANHRQDCRYFHDVSGKAEFHGAIL